MIQSTPEERAALQTAKEHYRDFVKKHPKRAEEERQALLSQIIDSEIPDWGSLNLKVSQKLF
jgi:hypothetical protein